MQKSLTLAGTAREVAWAAIVFYLRDMARHGSPSPNLAIVLAARTLNARQAPAHVIATIPLKPSSRIVLFIDPAFLYPYFERLAGMPMKIVQGIIVMPRRKLRSHEPAFRKFLFAIGHISASKNPEREHFFRRKLRLEIRREIPSRRFGKPIAIAMLHHIVHRDDLCFHTDRLNKIRHKKATPANKLPCANLCGTDIAYARNIFIRVLIHEFLYDHLHHHFMPRHPGRRPRCIIPGIDRTSLR